MSEGIWSHRFWHMTSSNQQTLGWNHPTPIPTSGELPSQDDSSIQRGATKKGQPQASLRAPERRKTSGVLLKKDPDMHKERAIDWASWGEGMDSFMMRCDLFRTWKVVYCFVSRCLWEPGTWHTHTHTESSFFLTEVWIGRSPLSPHMGHDSSETALPQEQQVGQVLRLLEILIWKDSELQALLRREGRAFSDLVASLQQEGSSGSDLLQASKGGIAVCPFSNFGTLSLERHWGLNKIQDFQHDTITTNWGTQLSEQSICFTVLLFNIWSAGGCLAFCNTHPRINEVNLCLSKNM